MVLPRLELMAEMAGDREVVRNPLAMAELRESYRYMASVCRSLVPGLEEELGDLPESITALTPVEEKVARQMALIRRANRLHRSVEAYLDERASRDHRAAGAN
jgi:hypothetical protein